MLKTLQFSSLGLIHTWEGMFGLKIGLFWVVHVVLKVIKWVERIWLVFHVWLACFSSFNFTFL